MSRKIDGMLTSSPGRGFHRGRFGVWTGAVSIRFTPGCLYLCARCQIAADWTQEFDVHESFRDDERAVVEELPTIDEALTPFMQLESSAEASGRGADDNDDDDQTMAAAAAAAALPAIQRQQQQQRSSSKRASRRSGDEDGLYRNEGQFNPHAAREQRRKKRKSTAKAQVPDYDFDEHM